MALVRCKECGQPQSRRHRYVHEVQPEGYPSTAAVCGRSGCHQPGMLWLNENEQAQYKAGQRVFQLPTAAVKIRAA